MLERCFFALIAFANSGFAAEEIVADSMAADGVRSIQIKSEYQNGQTLVRIHASKEATAGETLRVLYVLPVEAKEESRFGDGLQEVLKSELQTKHKLIVVAPSFAQLPWYADHATDALVRQESYFINVVVPLVDRLYPGAKRERLLLGFSKSGWGALSLILRHPDLFKAAAAWDAPLMKEKPDQFGMGGIFGTQENFEKYRISNLLRERGEPFQKVKRIWLGGFENFRQQTLDAHALMDELKIQHAFADGPKRKHVWGSGWVADAIEFLVRE